MTTLRITLLSLFAAFVLALALLFFTAPPPGTSESTRVARAARDLRVARTSAPATAPSTRGAKPRASSPLEAKAREALKKVGRDPEAERIWITAISNPELSADDRRNLIEDLNESGFPDPDHLTAADLPLIEARLELITRLEPQAIDSVNTEAFEEALKDLVQMRERARAQ